jgi:hypothetical protein
MYGATRIAFDVTGDGGKSTDVFVVAVGGDAPTRFALQALLPSWRFGPSSGDWDGGSRCVTSVAVSDWGLPR